MNTAADRAEGPVLEEDDLRLVDAGSARDCLALFREPFWVRAGLLVVVLSVAFVLLGRWQLHRHEGKVERRDLIAANYDARPLPLADVLGSASAPLPANRTWQPVRVRGIYDPARTLLVRNRPYAGQYGYEVLVPLRLADGSLLVVDRGWIPFGESATRLPAVPAAPAGEVDVVVRLRPYEPSEGGFAVAGQVRRIAADEIAAALPTTHYAAYGVLATEQPAATAAPRLLPRPDTGLGPHLAYAWNWWGFAVAAYAVLLHYALREVRRRRLATRGITLEEVDAARRRRRRRRRDRDEDVEDAALGDT